MSLKDIKLYKKDLKKLQIMKKTYESIEMLPGAYYNDMMDEINLQIKDVKTFIKNLEKSKINNG